MRNVSTLMWISCCRMGGVGLIVALLGSGCTTEKLSDSPSGATASIMRIRWEAGMEIALDPFVEPRRTRQFFGINAAAEGIGIVFARISNSTPSQTFLIEKKNFRLVPAGASSAQQAETKTIERGIQGGQATAWVGLATGGGVLLGVGGLMISHSLQIQRNFIEKEMPDQTLAPGQFMEGFIYYRPVPKDAGWSRGASVRINLTETKSHETVSITLPLSQ